MTDSSSPSVLAARPNSVPRRVAYRTKGRGKGQVRRLMSPGDLGQMLKPFVFLDLFRIEPAVPTRFGMHPHSGIATLTFLIGGEMHFSRRDGGPGSMAEGGVEWMMAGGGVWHGSPLSSPSDAAGFQLWVALPPNLESAPSDEVFLSRDEIPSVGPAKVLMGDYQGAHHRVVPPSAMTCLHVSLAAGERWTFELPPNHSVAWIALDRGLVDVGERIGAGALAVFEAGPGALDFHAVAASSFVLGSAVPHPCPLVLGNYSVRTNSASLVDGERKIGELGAALRRTGRLA